MDEEKTYSRKGTARALVLLASALALAGAALVFLLAVVFGPTLLDRRGLTGTVVLATAVFGAFVLVGTVVGNLLAVRARSTKGVVGAGCGTLLAGAVVGLGVMLLLISRSA